MKIVRPMTINDGQLSSSSIAETDATAYNAATAYGVGDLAMIVSPAATVTISIATRALVTWTAHGLRDGTPVTFSTTGALPTGITAGQRYYTRDVTTNSFKLCDRPGGTAITTSGSQSGTHTGTAQIHKIYESLQAANTGHYPPSDDPDAPTWWLDLGSTNRWRMLDSSVTSQSSAKDSIAVTLATAGRIDTVALLNVSAATAWVVGSTNDDGVVYDQTVSLIANSGINDPYAYCFEPIVRKADVLFSDLPPYANMVVTITLSNTGYEVKCGAAVVGLSRDVGDTQYGASVGITDYSVKTQDDFGNYSVVERAFSKRSNLTFMVDNILIDELQRLLAQYRALPTLYVGADDYASTYIYGFFKDFNVNIAYPNHSICTAEFEGLT